MTTRIIINYYLSSYFRFVFNCDIVILLFKYCKNIEISNDLNITFDFKCYHYIVQIVVCNVYIYSIPWYTFAQRGRKKYSFYFHRSVGVLLIFLSLLPNPLHTYTCILCYFFSNKLSINMVSNTFFFYSVF